MWTSERVAKIEQDVLQSLKNEATILADLSTLLQRTQHIMATIDQLEADEAALKTATTQLITLAGNLLSQLQQLSNNPALPAAVQSKIDDLHAKFTADLATVTSAISADSTPITPPSPTLPAPTITAVEPATGAAGDQVTITGTAFTGAEAVDFGGAPVANTDFHAVSDTEIQAKVPAGGTGRVTVTTASGVSNAGTFTYATPATAAAPAMGPTGPFGGEGATGSTGSSTAGP